MPNWPCVCYTQPLVWILNINLMKIPKFQPDQLILVLVVGMVILAIALWRYLTLHLS